VVEVASEEPLIVEADNSAKTEEPSQAEVPATEEKKP
jgi:hypothetical protein